MKYLKEFNIHNDYLDYIASSIFASLDSDSVSYCVQQNDVHFNKYVPETKLVCKYNVTSTSEPTVLRTNYEQNIFKSMEIDDVMLDNLVTEYIFETTGIHTVKYELYNDTGIGNAAPAFNNTYLTEIIIPDSVVNIYPLAFFGCSNLTNVTFSNNLEYIDAQAFMNCSSLTSITIPDSVIQINDNAFHSSGITSVTIGSGVRFISNSAFNNCNNLTNITIPDTVTGIGTYGFANCDNLISVTIGNGVTNIDYGAFGSGSNITSVTIGSGVTSIGDYAFSGCINISSMTIQATTPPTVNSNTFSGSYPIYVPAESVEIYKTASSWSDYIDRIQAIQE